MWATGFGRHPFGSPSVDIVRRWCGLAIATLLLPLILSATPALLHERATALLATRAHASAVRTPHHPPVMGMTALPTGLGPIVNATLAPNDPADYAAFALPSPADGLQAANPANQFTTTFGRDAIEIAPATGAPWTMQATAISTDGGRLPLAAAAPIISGTRVEYRRDGMTEWYVNGPQGLEQGFTLIDPPARARATDGFTLLVGLDGVTARTSGSALTLSGADGRQWRYGDLSATDATGKTLPATLTAAAGSIRITVDDAGAVYPVVVDPLVQEQELTASDGVAVDFFGGAVALSADGNTALIKAASKNGPGVVYVFVRSGATWSQQQKLNASDGAAGDAFGGAVALSADGNTALIGALGKSNKGAAYVFVRSGITWSQQQELTASDGAAFDSFGERLALSADGNTALIGAKLKNNQQGAAYVFVRSGTTWSQQQKLTASDGAQNDAFGDDVALSGDGNTALIGAEFKNSNQ